jgi:hypothetical protein
MFNVLQVAQILIVILMSGTAAFGQRHEYSPFATMGFGLAHFSESDSTVADQPNPNQSSETNGVFAFGFGLDVKVYSILSIRGEVRDFYADLPPLNVQALSDRQHNALISAGIVLRF